MIESMGICDGLAAQGKYLGSSPLQSVTTAASVRVRDGRTLVTDGPFAETTEQLGGYYMLDLADLDEAIAVAARAARRQGDRRDPPARCPGWTTAGSPLPTAADGGSRTPFLLLCYDDEAAWQAAGPQALAGARAEAAAFARRLWDEGRYLGASPLHPSATATCVRVRGGRRRSPMAPFPRHARSSAATT